MHSASGDEDMYRVLLLTLEFFHVFLDMSQPFVSVEIPMHLILRPHSLVSKAERTGRWDCKETIVNQSVRVNRDGVQILEMTNVMFFSFFL